MLMVFTDSINLIIWKAIVYSILSDFTTRQIRSKTFVIMTNPDGSILRLVERTCCGKIKSGICRAAVSNKLNSIKTDKTIIGSNPHITGFILHKSCDCHSGKTIFCGPGFADVICKKGLICLIFLCSLCKTEEGKAKNKKGAE